MTSSNAPSPPETNFLVAASVLTGAAGLVTATLKFLPLERLFDLPSNILQTISTVANIACIAIALGIAVASYAAYRKSRKRTLLLSSSILFCAFALLALTYGLIANWVVRLPTCEDPMALIESGEAIAENDILSRGIRIIRPASPPVKLAKMAKERGLEDVSVEQQIDELACEGDTGTQIRRAIEERNQERRMILTALPILVITLLFSGLTLLAWTLAFVAPSRQAAAPANKRSRQAP